MSVAVLYYKVTQESISSGQVSEQISDWVVELPENKQEQVKKLRHIKDQALSLAGLQLLKIALSDLLGSPFSLQTLQFPLQGKPYLESDNIDFNISHSGDVVCCVVSNTVKIGIDIELQRQVLPAMRKKLFSVKNTASEQVHSERFFTLWTKNEAIIKAANSGSIYNMKDIQHESKGAQYQDQFWYTYPVDIVYEDENKEYTCHIASSEQLDTEKITIKHIHKL